MAAIPYLIYLLALILLLYRISIAKKRKEMFSLLASLIAGSALAIYQNTDMGTMLTGILIFNCLASTFHSRENYLVFLISILFIIPIHMQTVLVSQMMLLGLLSGIYFFLKPNASRDPQLERKRDIVQIIAGFVLIYAFATFSQAYAELFVIGLILLSSIIGNFAISNKRNEFSRILYSLERKNAAFGQGAIWLSIGVLTAISFLQGNQIIAVLAAILVGDAVATIVGTHYRFRLPYNKKKSVYGSLAYFICTSLILFPFFGSISILISLVGALVESVPNHIDDNFDTALVLTILLKLLSFGGLI